MALLVVKVWDTLPSLFNPGFAKFPVWPWSSQVITQSPTCENEPNNIISLSVAPFLVLVSAKIIRLSWFRQRLFVYFSG